MLRTPVRRQREYNRQRNAMPSYCCCAGYEKHPVCPISYTWYTPSIEIHGEKYKQNISCPLGEGATDDSKQTGSSDTKTKGFGQNQVYTWPLLGQNRGHTKSKYKSHARSPAIGQVDSAPDFGSKRPGYTAVTLSTRPINSFGF